MDLGFKQRERAKPRRRPATRPTARAPRPASEPPKKREGAPPGLWNLVGDAVHGFVFLALAVASVLYFGQSFAVVAAVVVALALVSLKEAWSGLQARHSKPHPGP